jgi:hypothetical protein
MKKLLLQVVVLAAFGAVAMAALVDDGGQVVSTLISHISLSLVRSLVSLPSRGGIPLLLLKFVRQLLGQSLPPY